MKIQKTNNSLPGDLLIQIFKDLPVKTLLRFRCVSKHWQSLIDDPLFVNLHRIQSYSRPGGVSLMIQMNSVSDSSSDFYLFHPEEGTVPSHVLSDTEGNSQECVMAEGLLCFYNEIWNPSTRKRIHLPPEPEPISSESELQGPRRYVLGFNRSSNEYKVLSLRRAQTERIGTEIEYKCVAKVLTLGTNSWSNIDLGHDALHCSLNHIAFCSVNSILYIFPFLTGLMIAFDLGAEKSRLVLAPDVGWIHSPWLLDVRGNLVLYNVHKKFVLELEDENGGRWEEVGEINPPEWDVDSPKWSSHYPYSFLYDLRSVPVLNKILGGRFYRCSKQVETLFRSSESPDL